MTTEPKTLNARGKGEVSYDYKNDFLIFKIKNRNYKKTLRFENFAIDIDEEKFITGIRVFDASQLFGMDKLALRNIAHWEFNAKMENNIVTVEFKFMSVVRNALLPFLSTKEQFTHQLSRNSPTAMPDARVECTA